MNVEQIIKERDEALKKVALWESELSKVMPPDFKDWWQNSKEEWPMVARMVIENLREREELAWKMMDGLCLTD